MKIMNDMQSILCGVKEASSEMSQGWSYKFLEK